MPEHKLGWTYGLPDADLRMELRKIGFGIQIHVPRAYKRSVRETFTLSYPSIAEAALDHIKAAAAIATATVSVAALLTGGAAVAAWKEAFWAALGTLDAAILGALKTVSIRHTQERESWRPV